VIDRIFGFVLLFNLAGLSSIVALLSSGARAGEVGALLLACNLAYLAHRWPSARRLLGEKLILAWLFVFAWPAVNTLLLMILGEIAMSPADYAKNAATALLRATLLLSAAVYVQVAGWNSVRKIGHAAIAVTVFGFVLALLYPGLFASATDMVDAEGSTGRAFGFFLQPNRAAPSVVVILVLILTDLRRHDLRASLGKILLVVGLAVATGSRGGILLALVVATVWLWSLRRELGGINWGLKGLRAAMRWVALAAVAGVLVLAALGALGSFLTSRNMTTVGDRLTSLVQLASFESVTSDKSVAARLKAQRTYLGLIAEKPLLGHGPNAVWDYLASSDLERYSHNTFLENAFENGIPHVVVICCALFMSFRQRHRRQVESLLHSNAISQLLALIAFESMIAGGVLQIRGLIVVLGTLLAFQLSPQRVLSKSRLARRHATPPRQPATPALDGGSMPLLDV